jgi:hypothetical protein
MIELFNCNFSDTSSQQAASATTLKENFPDLKSNLSSGLGQKYYDYLLWIQKSRSPLRYSLNSRDKYNTDQLNSFYNGNYDRDMFISLHKSFYSYCSYYSYSSNISEDMFDNMSDDFIQNYFYPAYLLSSVHTSPSVPPLCFNYDIEHTTVTGEKVFESIRNLASTFNPNPNLYPIAVRQILESGYVAIERPPFKISVDFRLGQSSSSASKLKKVEIWVPWTLTFINPTYVNRHENINHNVYIYLSDGSLDQMGERKYIRCPFPNSYQDSHICFNNSLSTLPVDQLSSLDIPTIYTTVFNDYFSGGWNSDLWNEIVSRMQGIFPSSFNPKVDFYRDSYSYLTSAQKKRMSQSLNFYSSSTKAQYKDFFMFMGGLTLSETLEVYSATIEKYGSTYNDILENYRFSKPTSYDQATYKSKLNLIARSNSDFSQLSTRFNLNLIITNLQIEPFLVDVDKIEDVYTSLPLSQIISNKVNLSHIYEYISDYSQKILETGDVYSSHYIYYDFLSNEFSFNTTDMTTSPINFCEYINSLVQQVSDV